MESTKKSTGLLKERIGEILEVPIVLILGFGLFIYSSTVSLLQNSGIANTQTYNSFDFIFIVTYEITVLIIIGYFLNYRQWRLNYFNLKFTFPMIGTALLLVVLRETTGIFLTKALIALKVFNPEEIYKPSISLDVNIVSIALITVINSIYEEVLLIGYFFKRFEKYHPTLIIFLSFAVRASYHTYQGWMNLPMVLTLALIFGVYYVKYKKLWPLIIAHGIGNLFHFLNEQFQLFDQL